MSWNPPSSSAPFIARFYGEGARDFDGRTLIDILRYNNSTLETKHNYIQVLFPLPEPSPYNPRASLVNEATRDAFLQNSSLRDRLFQACERMANFYGFDIVIAENDYTFVPKPDFMTLASSSWLTTVDHNHLRISRIIRSLRVLGHERLALALYDALAREGTGVINPNSLEHWMRATKRPLHLPSNELDDDAEGTVWLRHDRRGQ